MRVVRNTFGWKMAYHDIAFLIQTLHSILGERDAVQSFDFVVNYTNDTRKHKLQTIAIGGWETGNAAATS